MTLGNQPAENINDICNLFAEFFKEVYEPNHSNTQTLTTENNFSLIQFNCDMVEKYMMNLDENKTAGPDGIPPILLKRCASALAPTLTNIFNTSLRTSQFPDEWKISHICPIFKSGSRLNIENYRGISILSAIPKMFECMVKDALMDHIKTIISFDQHGFFPGRSTVTNLMLFNKYLITEISKGAQVDAIYTDFSKAFDKVDHSVLMEVLNNYNSELIPVNWLQSYLRGRYQYVKIGGVCSDKFPATSGVPQGSHLGPILFILLINDVKSCLKYCNCLMYADDMKLFYRVKGEEDAALIQEDLNSFYRWLNDHKLTLNVKKCKSITFSKKKHVINFDYKINNEKLIKVEQIRDLGVLFSSDLSFVSHINQITNKAKSLLGFIKRNTRDFHDPYTLKSLYTSLVRSVLEYASVLWTPYYEVHSSKIESIQKQFLEYAFRRQPRNNADPFILPPYNERCNLIHLQSLSTRRQIAQKMFIFDILSSKIDSPELLQTCNFNTSRRRLRRQPLLEIQTCKNNYTHNEPIIRAMRTFNSTNDTFDFNQTRLQFKNTLMTS